MSGTAGLVYEVLWVRMIGRIMGGSALTVSAVLTVFMAGLALGSVLFGRRVDGVRQRRSLIRLYGFLEIGIGAYALLLPRLIEGLLPLYRWIYNHEHLASMVYPAATFAGCALLLIVPTTLMGGTLPLLCRYYVSRPEHLGSRTGALYGLNTLGAAFGTLACGFVLIPVYGVSNTLFMTASVNITAGLACLLASGLEKGLNTVPAFTGPVDTKKTGQNIGFHRVTLALVLFGVSGFCAMAHQVFWTRLIGLLIGPTHYSFTLVVATFIIGLAAGSVLFGWVADRTRRPLLVLALTQSAAAVSALLVSQMLGNTTLLFAKLIDRFQHDFALLLPAQSLVLFTFMLLPTLFLGAAFPLVNRIVTRSGTVLGKTIGTGYAVNTLGAIAGSFTAGFVLVPGLGMAKSMSLVFVIQFTAAAFILCTRLLPPTRLRRPAVIACCSAGIFMAVMLPSWNGDHLSRGWYRDFASIRPLLARTSWFEALFNGAALLQKQREGVDVVFKGEGAGGFTTVEKEITSVGTVEYAMFNSGKADASSHGDRSTQTLSAHLPMLFHPNAERVMVLGLASGMTPGEVLHYPVRHLDVVELNRQVVKACGQFFSPWNNRCLSDPRTRVIVQDGRNHLTLTDRHYDVIISEPSNPWMAGLSDLYTREFFQCVRTRLTEQGIFAQWIQSYELDWDTFALLGRTFVTVFPQGALIKIGPVDYLMMARADNQPLSWSNVFANHSHALRSVQADFSNVRCLARLVVTEDLKALFGPGDIHTDTRPHLEYTAPKHLNGGTLCIEEQAAPVRRLSAATKSIMDSLDHNEARLDLLAFAASLNAPLFNTLDYESLNDKEKQRYLAVTCDYCQRETLPGYGIFDDPEPRSACADIQARRIIAQIERAGERAMDRYNLALSRLASGKKREALDELIRALKLDEHHTDARIALGLLYAESGRLRDAESCFQRVIDALPTHHGVHGYLGMVQARLGLTEKALTSLNKALELFPADAAVLNERAELWLHMGRVDEAGRDIERALAVNPNDPLSHTAMARVLVRRGDKTSASRHLEKAIELSPDNDQLRHNPEWLTRSSGVTM